MGITPNRIQESFPRSPPVKGQALPRSGQCIFIMTRFNPAQRKGNTLFLADQFASSVPTRVESALDLLFVKFRVIIYLEGAILCSKPAGC